MGSDWPKVALTDVYDISSGLSKPAKDFGSGFPFLAFKDVFYNVFVPAQLTQLVQSNEKEQAACSIKRGDVFLTRTSETMNELGMSSVALKDYEKATFNGFSKRLRPKPSNTLHPEYVAYYLRSPKFRTEMLAFSTMSTRASLNNEMISRLSITVPPVEVQKSIAWILKTLDDKIELNRQMNTTLEAMAQALFKSWFVDFDPVIDNALAAGNPIPDELAERAERRKQLHARSAEGNSAHLTPGQPLPAAIQKQFPDRFVFTEEMGWVPEGWSALSLSSAIQINPKVTLRKGHVAKYVDMKALPTSGYGIDDFVLKPYAGGAKFANDDVLLARITPCLENGKTGLVDFLEDNEPGFGSTEFIVMRGKGAISTAYVACLARDTNFRLHCVASMVGSSGRQRVQNACFDSYFVCIPEDEEVLKLFDTQCSPFFTKMTALKNETVSLASLRDTLLPKLLSGQLRIPEAEQQVAEIS